MAQYRILKNLLDRERRSEISALKGLTPEQIGKLEGIGAVSRLHAPPLAILPGWADRAAQLAAINIKDGEQLLDADPVIIAAECGVSEGAARQWQREMVTLLTMKS